MDIWFACRPYEVIAVATYKGITIWHLGLNPDPDGRLSTEKVALLSGHEGEVLCQHQYGFINMKCNRPRKKHLI